LSSIGFVMPALDLGWSTQGVVRHCQRAIRADQRSALLLPEDQPRELLARQLGTALPFALLTPEQAGEEAFDTLVSVGWEALPLALRCRAEAHVLLLLTPTVRSSARVDCLRAFQELYGRGLTLVTPAPAVARHLAEDWGIDRRKIDLVADSLDPGCEIRPRPPLAPSAPVRYLISHDASMGPAELGRIVSGIEEAGGRACLLEHRVREQKLLLRDGATRQEIRWKDLPGLYAKSEVLLLLQPMDRAPGSVFSMFASGGTVILGDGFTNAAYVSHLDNCLVYPANHLAAVGDRVQQLQDRDLLAALQASAQKTARAVSAVAADPILPILRPGKREGT